MDARILDAESLFVRTIASAASAGGDRAGALLRDREQLARLCSACFWASLEAEEGRVVRGTLSLCSPKAARSARAFTRAVPASVPELVGLLTASPRAALAVQAGADPDSGPEIWGLLDVEPEGDVRLRVAGNGILLASRARRVLVILNRGVAAVPVAADEITLSKLVAGSLGKERFLEQHAGTARRFSRTLATMLRQGHGGMLLIVPPEDQGWRDGVSLRYRFDEAGGRLLQHSVRAYESQLREALRDYNDMRAGRAGAQSIGALRERYDAVHDLHALSDELNRRVGDLGRIDGAVVMDMDLQLHGFGAKLLYGAAEFAVTTLNAVTGELRSGVPISTLGGMRHQSAARYVFDHRETDVFVVSQEGRLCMVSWSERTQTLAVVQNLEHFLWEYREF